MTIYRAILAAVCDECLKEILPKSETPCHWDYGFTNPRATGGLLSEEFSLHWCSEECMHSWYDTHRGILPVDVAWS
jgi:hypothetical protein